MPCHKVSRSMPHGRQAFAKFLLFILGHAVCAVRDEMQTGWSDDGDLQKLDPALSFLNIGPGPHIGYVQPRAGVEWHEEHQQDATQDSHTDPGKQRTSAIRHNAGMETQSRGLAFAPRSGDGNHKGNSFEGVSRIQLLNVGGGSTASQALHGKAFNGRDTFAGAGSRGMSSPAAWQVATVQRQAENPGSQQHNQSSETGSSSDDSETGSGTHPYPGRSHEWAKYDYKKSTGDVEGMRAVVEAVDAAKDWTALRGAPYRTDGLCKDFQHKDKAVDKARAVQIPDCSHCAVGVGEHLRSPSM